MITILAEMAIILRGVLRDMRECFSAAVKKEETKHTKLLIRTSGSCIVSMVKNKSRVIDDDHPASLKKTV